jgi:CRP-like cAMP-binding protein
MTPDAEGPSAGRSEVVVRRLQSLGADPLALKRLSAVPCSPDRADAKIILQREGQPLCRPRFLLSGWACRFRYLSDGRRQIFDFVLPGDGIGVCERPHAVASSTTQALTPVTLLDAGRLFSQDSPQGAADLRSALETAKDIRESRGLDAMMRLGRMTALERTAHLLLELHDRMEAVGLAQDGRFPLPVTQETLADALGMSVVHVNRTLQEMRRERLVVLERGTALLPNRPTLADRAHYTSGPTA